jgi:hypothetical protein
MRTALKSIFSRRVIAEAVGNDEYTVVLLHMDGAAASTTFTDSAASGSHTWTAVGNAQIGATSKFGSGGGLFDGTGDYISTPHSTDWVFGSADWTIDLWFNRASNGVLRSFIRGETTGFVRCFQVYLLGDNTLHVDVTYPNLGSKTVTGTTAFTTAGWHHVAVVRNGDTMTLYVDGVSEGTPVTGLTGEAVRAPSGPLIVGAGANGGSDYWNGSLDEVRISKGIARWTENFTPPTGAYS